MIPTKTLPMKQIPTTARSLPTPQPAAWSRGDALDRLLTTMLQGEKKWLSELGSASAALNQNPAAVDASKEVAENPLPKCPFCRLSDQLEEVNWSNERADGSEYIGLAVRCNRCSAIAPVAAWLSLGFAEHQTGKDA